MEVKVLGFLIWTIIFGICTAMIWQFLFWYVLYLYKYHIIFIIQ